MKPDEEELQRNVESGKITDAGDLDVKAYQHVFTAFKQVPGPRLPASFADRVVQKILQRQQEKESSTDLWWLGIGLFLLCIAFIVAFAFIGFRINVGFLSAITDFRGLIVLFIVLMGVFHWMDKKLVARSDRFA